MKIELTHEQVDQIVLEELKWILQTKPDLREREEWVQWKEAATQLLTLYEVPE